MRHVIKLPKFGDTAEGVLVTEWVAGIGEAMGEGATLFTAETDKIDVDVPTPIGGMLVEQLVQQGDEVTTGDPVAVIET